jgi:prepilin-type processing-associated H-X9-DG protein
MAAAPVQAQTASEKKGPGDAGSNPAAMSFELTYLPAETRMFLAMQPAALLGRAEMRPLLKLLANNEGLGKEFLLQLVEIEQLVVFWEGSPQNPANPAATPFIPHPSGYIVRSARPQEWKQVVGRVWSSMEDVQHAGQIYLRPTRVHAGRFPMSLYTPDDRTAVLAPDDLLRTLIEDRKEPRARRPWDDPWNQVTKGQINAVLETRWLRRRFNQGEMKLNSIAPLLEKVRAYTLGISLDSELSADLRATVGDAADVKPVTETLQALLTLGRNTVPSLREHAADAGQFPEANDLAIGTLSTLLDKARVEAAGQTVRLQASSPVDVATVARILSSFAGAAKTSTRIHSVNNLKQIALAFLNFHSSENHLPPPVLYGGKSGKVPYSWRVALLPYLEQQELYNSYNFDEPWDGPSNSKLIEKMPAVYGYPGLGGTSTTHAAYFVFSGKQTILGSGDKPSLLSVTDGTSNTILAVEANRDVAWTKPEDIPFDPELPLPQIGGFTPDGANVAFGDGSVRYIKKTISPAVLKALVTPAGGEVISSDSF